MLILLLALLIMPLNAVADEANDIMHDRAQRCIKHVHDVHRRGDGKHIDDYFTDDTSSGGENWTTCRADLDAMSVWVHQLRKNNGEE